LAGAAVVAAVAAAVVSAAAVPAGDGKRKFEHSQ